MAAQIGDRIIVESQRVGRVARKGEILEIIEAAYWDPLPGPLGRRPGEHDPARRRQRANHPTCGAASGRGVHSGSGTDPAQGRRPNAEGLLTTRNAAAGDPIFRGTPWNDRGPSSALENTLAARYS